jgi:hypothetical protein
MKTAARVLALGLLAGSLGGCSLFQGLQSSLGSLLSLAISLALIAAPIALSYWLYSKGK